MDTPVQRVWNVPCKVRRLGSRVCRLDLQVCRLDRNTCRLAVKNLSFMYTTGFEQIVFHTCEREIRVFSVDFERTDWVIVHYIMPVN